AMLLPARFDLSGHTEGGFPVAEHSMVGFYLQLVISRFQLVRADPSRTRDRNLVCLCSHVRDSDRDRCQDKQHFGHGSCLLEIIGRLSRSSVSHFAASSLEELMPRDLASSKYVKIVGCGTVCERRHLQPYVGRLRLTNADLTSIRIAIPRLR